MALPLQASTMPLGAADIADACVPPNPTSGFSTAEALASLLHIECVANSVAPSPIKPTPLVCITWPLAFLCANSGIGGGAPARPTTSHHHQWHPAPSTNSSVLWSVVGLAAQQQQQPIASLDLSCTPRVACMPLLHARMPACRLHA